MIKQPNKLFAIVAATFTRREPGNDGKKHSSTHIFGVVFDVDAQGNACDFIPIDFDGKTVCRWEERARRLAPWHDTDSISAEKMLLFPITSETADLLKEAIDEVAIHLKKPQRKILPGHVSDDSQCEIDSPFYYGYVPFVQLPKLERFNRTPVDFNGKPQAVSRTEKLSYNRDSFSRARAATNCMDFLQNMLERIGGVPLNDLAPVGMTMPRNSRTKDLEGFIAQLADEQNTLEKQHNGGRVLDMGDGRKAYASNKPGWLTDTVNSLPEQTLADGSKIPFAQFLIEHSQPFYDPKLNEHNLGRTQPSLGGGR